MRFKFLALTLCALLVLSLTACSVIPETSSSTKEKQEETQAQTTPVEIEGYDRIDPALVEFTNPLYSGVELTKGYEALDTDAQRECYRLIDDSVYYVSSEAEEDGFTTRSITLHGESLSEAELHLVISAYTMDHPQVFWLDSKFSYYTTDTLTYLQLRSGLSLSEIESCAEKMAQTIDDIFSSMESGLSMYERELYIHDAFAERCEYAGEGRDEFRVFTSIGGLVDFSAVCEGYSRAMQILLAASGIETYYVSGIGNDGLHMWNTVNLDGQWYYLDVTWNDNDGGDTDYDHFNLTTEQLLVDHSISPLYWELTEDEVCGGDTNMAANFNIFVPDCEDEDSNFYSQNAVTLTAFDEENLNRIADRMIEAANAREEAVYIYIDPDHLSFSRGVDNLFYSGDYAIFTCISKANEQLQGVKISDDYVSTTESEDFSVVTVYLEYEQEN